MMKSFVFSLLFLVPAFGLDVSLYSFECDESLPFYAVDLTLSCGNSNRCTFGSSSFVSGELVYTDVEASNIVDATVYATASLQFMTLEYHLFQDRQLNMCGKWITYVDYGDNAVAAAEDGDYRKLADVGDDAAAAGDDAAAAGDDYAGDDAQQDGACPEDGNYLFQVSYDLPAADHQTSWLATGWEGVGQISFFAEAENSDSLVGYCTLKLKTHVTPSAERQFNPPSALMVSFITLAAVAAVLLLCIYCSCCRSTPKAKEAKREQLIDDDDPIEKSRAETQDFTSRGSGAASYQNMDY